MEGEMQRMPKLRTNPNFLMREIAGESVLVPIGDAGVFENSVLSLNRTCCFLWKLFMVPCTPQQAIAQAKQTFSGPEEEIEEGVLQFIKEYVQYGLLMEVD